ncbi:MAG: serine hydrolase domain-containing protein [Gemmatimonadaceae bacterium]
MKNSLALSLLALLTFAPEARGQGDAVDTYVRAFIKKRSIPSAAIAVVQRGRVVKLAGYGESNLELHTAATGHSIFEIGSITKQFTATAILMLMEEGKLTLDDSLSRYLPEIPESWRAIRLRHLLTHTSGLHDWEGDSTFSYRREYTLPEFIAFVARHPLDFAPGSKFAYTNSAFPLLGIVVERVSGISIEQFVTQRIFAPAGMKESRFRRVSELVPNRASGYVELDSVLYNGEPLRPAILAANGLVLSSASDMARWSSALFDGKLLKASSLALMTTPTRFDDGTRFDAGGIGWFFGAANGHRLMVHNGSTVAGFSSVIYRYPDDALSVVVLLNIDRFDAVNVLATGVAGRYVAGIGGK